MSCPILIGVISDTHGLLRPEAVEALRGSDHIIHAGDVGSSEILETLSHIAPVTAVRGNTDKAAWARKLHETEVLEVSRVSIFVLHDLAQCDPIGPCSGSSILNNAMFGPNMTCSGVTITCPNTQPLSGTFG